MDCTEIRPLISYYHDGEATPEERARVEKHLAGCEDCRRVLAEYRAISGEMREMALPAPPVGLRRDVWRAIEAQQAGTGARVFGTPGASGAANRKRDKGTVVQFPQNRRKAGFAGVFSNFESGWSKALTAALVIGAMFIVLGVLIVLQNKPQVEVAQIEETQALVDYAQPVHIKFSKAVITADAVNYTSVWKTESGTDARSEITNISKTWIGGTDGKLEIKPVDTWEAGVTYKVVVDASKIGLGVGNQKLGDKPVDAGSFSTVAHTPTPTDTPTVTPIPTDTPVPPTPTREPTAVAINTTVPNVEPTATTQVEASTTPVPPTQTATTMPTATNTIAPKPTSTNTIMPKPSATSTRPAPPTNTSTATATTVVVPTNTAVPPQPTATSLLGGEPTVTETPVTARPTSTPAASSTPGKGTATIVPTPGKGTPTPPCNIMPVNGFGKVWSEHPEVRTRVGCPKEYETALQIAAQEWFQGGYMFWRGDTKMIYVFFWGSPNDSVGTWQEFPDTWNDGDPEPTPTQTLPPGTYTPVRGFGKLWRENSSVRQALGYAIEPERAVTGAWQAYAQGYALWTDNKVIRFMFKDDNSASHIWMRFEDTYVMPTATPAR